MEAGKSEGGGDAKGLEAKKVIEEIVAKKKGTEGGRVIFAMLAGSHAFNLAVATSDDDWFGLYAASLESLYTLSPPPESINTHDPDSQIHEIKAYLEILLKGNPKVIEPLFTSHLVWSTPEWEDFKKLRSHLLTKVTLEQYISYGLSQVKEVESGKAVETAPKKYCHAIRLLREAERIATGGEPIVWHDGEQRDYLLSIRGGQHSQESLKQTLLELKEKLNAMELTVPATTDVSILNDWLLSVRKKHRGEVTIRTEDTDEDNELKKRAQELLAKYGVVGRIIAVIPSGSKAHGLSGENSSDDYVAVYVAPTEKVLSMTPPPLTVDESGLDNKQKDYAKGMLIFEALGACKALCSGNHRLYEALFIDEEATKGRSYVTDEWRRLAALRDNFFSSSTLFHYQGIAAGQLKQKQLGAKNLYHAYRLLFEAEHIMNNKRPQVTPAEGDQKELLMKLHSLSGQSDAVIEKALIDEAIAKGEAVTKRIRKDYPKVVCDKKCCEEWLIELRNAHWTS